MFFDNENNPLERGFGVEKLKDKHPLVVVNGLGLFTTLQDLTGARSPLFNVLTLRQMLASATTPKQYTRYYLVDESRSDGLPSRWLREFQQSLRRSHWWVLIRESIGGLEMALKFDVMSLLRRHAEKVSRLIIVDINPGDIMFLIEEAHSKNIPVTIYLNDSGRRGLEQSLGPDDQVIQISQILPRIILPGRNGRVEDNGSGSTAVENMVPVSR